MFAHLCTIFKQTKQTITYKHGTALRNLATQVLLAQFQIVAWLLSHDKTSTSLWCMYSPRRNFQYIGLTWLLQVTQGGNSYQTSHPIQQAQYSTKKLCVYLSRHFKTHTQFGRVHFPVITATCTVVDNHHYKPNNQNI